MKEIDNTPIENLDVDWGDPDGTGRKAKSLGQVQNFIKDKLMDLPVLRFDKIEEVYPENFYHGYDDYTSETGGTVVFVAGKVSTFMYKVGNDYYSKWKGYNAFVEDIPSIPGLPPQPVGGKIYVCNNVFYMYQNRQLLALKAGVFLESNQNNNPQIIEGTSQLRICNYPLNFRLPVFLSDETLILCTDYALDGTSPSAYNLIATNRGISIVRDIDNSGLLSLDGSLELFNNYGPVFRAIQFREDAIYIGSSESEETDYGMIGFRNHVKLGREILRGVKTPLLKYDAANKEYVDSCFSKCNIENKQYVDRCFSEYDVDNKLYISQRLKGKQDRKAFLYIEEITDDNYQFSFSSTGGDFVIQNPLDHDLLVQIGPGENVVEVSFDFTIGAKVPTIDFCNYSNLWIGKPDFKPNTRYIVKILRRMIGGTKMEYIGDCKEIHLTT